MSIFAIILLLSGLAIGVSGIGGVGGGGGGGGGGSSYNNSLNYNVSSWASEVNPTKSSLYQTTEYNNISNKENAFNQINLSNAYSLLEQNGKNIAGDDINVAVIDTGINLTHSEFSGNKIRTFSDGINRDYANNDADISDVDGHGSHVAGIIAANRDNYGMHGVAFNAIIVGYKVFDDNNGGTNTNVTNAINQSINDSVSIVNLSLGFDNQVNDVRSKLVSAKNNDILTLSASGNDTADNPTHPAFYASDPDLQNYILSVGSVDSKNNISSFSNLCGSAYNYCLVAPGEDIFSAHIDSYSSLSGTSMATPMVSGVAAILRSAWPHLTAANTAHILLQSATDLGDIGVDSTYGNGLLNAEAAVNYIGQTLIPSAASINSFGYNLSDSNLITSSIFGDSFIKNVVPHLKTAVFFDNFGRDYKANFTDKISHYVRNPLLSNLIFDQYQSSQIPIVGNNSFFSLKLINQKKSKDLDGNIIGSNYFNINNFIYDKSKTDPYQLNNRNISFLYQKSFNKNIISFGSNNYSNQTHDRFLIDYNLVAGNPSFSQITSSHIGFDNLTKNTINIKHKISSFADSNLSFSQIFNNSNILNTDPVSNILQLGFDYKSDFFDIDVDYGNILEYKDRFLGGSAVGVFSNNNDSKTNFINIKNKRKIINNTYFISSYLEGITNLSGNQRGIFRNYSNIKSRGYSLGIFNNNFFEGKLAINYYEPLRVYYGDVDINIPTGYDNKGNVERLSINNISLEPSGKEKNLEISYNLSKENYNINLNLLAVEEPMNIKNNHNEYIIFLKYNKFW